MIHFVYASSFMESVFELQAFRCDAIPLQLSHFLPLRAVHCVDDCFSLLLGLIHLLQHLEMSEKMTN